MNTRAVGECIGTDARLINRDGNPKSIAGKFAYFPSLCQVYGISQFIFFSKFLGFGDS
jgi:hypothetical protein